MKAFFVLVLTLLVSCEINDTEDIGTLVPPTTSEDGNLPQLTINVSGHSRSIHLQTFGSPENPPLFVLHGGPGADFRLLLPLKELADDYYMVMWDSRGAGVSERVGKDELTIDSFDEEVAQVKQQLAPNRKIILVGHSFGGNVFAKYAARHPENVQQLVLIEPGRLNNSIGSSHNGGNIRFLDGQNFFWQNEILTSSDHASADYKAVELLPKSARNWTCDGSIINNYPFWRFGSYHYYIVQKNTRKLPSDYNWVAGIENFEGKISVVSGTCGALSESYQRNTNLPALPNAELFPVQDAGHITLFTDYADQTVETVRNVLE